MFAAVDNAYDAAATTRRESETTCHEAVARFGVCLRDAGGVMLNAHHQEPSSALNPSLERRLDSWKEIAAYLGRGVRTVQRWEREEGLPVHRLGHDKRGSVYATREELAAWWESRRLTLGTQTAGAPDGAAVPAGPRLERVTRTSAMTAWPALSSDARLIAYVSDGGQDGTTPQIWIQQIGGAALRLTNGKFEYSNLSFSPDDTRILFAAGDDEGSNVYEIPTLGGEARLVQRGATSARFSPDGRWLASVARDAVGVRFADRGGVGYRTVASELVDVVNLTWLPNCQSVLVHAHPNPALEADWWIIPIDGGPPVNTGLIRRLRERIMFALPSGVAWVDDSLVFSGAGPQGVSLYKQRLVPSTFEPVGPPQRLTPGNESAWLPTVAAGRLAFLSSRADANLWSVAIDGASGTARGPLQRLTRGPGILGYLSTTSDFRTLAYSSVRLGDGDVFLRDLKTDSETTLMAGPEGGKWYPALSPNGSQVAFGTRVTGSERATRPIFIARLSEGTWSLLGDDCGGRPRQWVDERLLIIERFGRSNRIALLDTQTGDQRELLESAERSITNPRLSPDDFWIAFDASRPGAPADVYVARFRDGPIPESEWTLVEHAASHPFWSADGRLLYYTPTGTNPIIRSAIRARRFDAGSGRFEGEPIAVYASAEMAMPAYLAGTAPIATPDEIILVLGDFRGDVWLMDL
jgi:Tol biopolymer transport system component